jgi:hypothetical protein
MVKWRVCPGCDGIARTWWLDECEICGGVGSIPLRFYERLARWLSKISKALGGGR